MIQEERIKRLNHTDVSEKGIFILYWMQAAQRVSYNHALEHAANLANEHKRPLIVLFNIVHGFPEASARHYRFMLEGLREIPDALDKRGIGFVITLGDPVKEVSVMAKDAVLVVTDRGYLRIQNKWRKKLAEKLTCPLIQVESNVIVPVEEASPKEEYGAYTIRPKLRKKLESYYVPVKPVRLKNRKHKKEHKSLDISDIDKVLKKIKIPGRPDHSSFTGGYNQARKLLNEFISEKLNDYDEGRNDPNLDCLSHMSPYLHFGQIAPLEIALEVLAARGQGKDAYLEELIIRRELAHNFVHYNPEYDNIAALPDWARKTLEEHQGDKREYTYTRDKFENAKTHDPYWNAAQKEMVITGKMHGYMRMYWGKKILEWSETPEKAWQTALYLNDKYELDGRDPNGYGNIAWCFGKHDRPWQERPIFGKVRYMNANGLRRKFDADAYVEKIEKLEGESS